MNKKLLYTFLGIILASTFHVLTIQAAPTSTLVRYLFLDPAQTGGNNLCLERTSTGLVVTSTAACGTGSGGGVATSGTPIAGSIAYFDPNTSTLSGTSTFTFSTSTKILTANLAYLTTTSTTSGRKLTLTSDGSTSTLTFDDTKLNLRLGGGSSDPIEIYDSSWGGTAIRTPRAGVVSVGIDGFTPETGELGQGFIGAVNANESTPSYYCYSSGDCFSRALNSLASHTWTIIGNQKITTNNSASGAGIKLDATGGSDIVEISSGGTGIAKWKNNGSYEILQSANPSFLSNLGSASDQFTFNASNTKNIVNGRSFWIKDGTVTSTSNNIGGFTTGALPKWVVSRLDSTQSSWMQSNQWCLGNSASDGGGSTCGVNVSMAGAVHFDNTDNARDILFSAGNSATRTTSTVIFRPARSTTANDSSVVFQKLGNSSSTNTAFLQVQVGSTIANYKPDTLFAIGYNTSVTNPPNNPISSSSAVFWVDKFGGVNTTSTANSTIPNLNFTNATGTSLRVTNFVGPIVIDPNTTGENNYIQFANGSKLWEPEGDLQIDNTNTVFSCSGCNPNFGTTTITTDGTTSTFANALLASTTLTVNGTSSLQRVTFTNASGTNITASGFLQGATLNVSGVSTFSNQVLLSNGTAAAPSQAWTGNSANSGWFLGNTDTPTLVTDGTARIAVNTTVFQSTLPFQGSAGSAATPSHSFSGDTDTGLFSAGANILGFSAGGREMMRLASSTQSLTLTDTDVYITTSTRGVIFTSPSGSCFRMTITDSGNFATSSLTCP